MEYAKGRWGTAETVRGRRLPSRVGTEEAGNTGFYQDRRKVEVKIIVLACKRVVYSQTIRRIFRTVEGYIRDSLMSFLLTYLRQQCCKVINNNTFVINKNITINI